MKRKRSVGSRRTGAGLIGSLASAVGDVAGTVLNKAVDLLPVELHIPGYQYCGPGTKLNKRLNRGDPGVNKLDAACKLHDIAYARHSDTTSRAKADRELAERAWTRVKAADAGLAEKAAAWTVTNLMKAKAKFGGGRVRRKKTGGGGGGGKNQVKKKKRGCGASVALKRLKAMVGRGLYLRPYTKSGSGHGRRGKKNVSVATDAAL